MEEEEEEEEEEGEEQVMSEVHLGCPPRSTGPCTTHFTFSVPSIDVVDGRSNQKLSLDDNAECSILAEKNNSAVHGNVECSDHCDKDPSSDILTVDNDGDLVVSRRRNKTKKCLTYVMAIKHNITSSLRNVGLQVWRASLVLTDYVLHRSFTSCDFNGITAIELGAGTGLVGIALARVAGSVFITDIGTEILDNCATNVHLNSSWLKFDETEVHVRELDWRESWPPLIGKFDLLSQPRSRYSWTSAEIEEAERAVVLLAADVIYSDNLTDLFFGTLEKLMSHGSEKVLYLALEKRYNFSMEELDVVANGYEHFRSFLNNDEDCGRQNDKLPPCFKGEQIDISEIPQYVKEYERGKDVELWRITYCLRQQT
ncbi:methyltransferase-like protein 22 isoform X1 [Ananas comosus]|uniref:Methyltransferase-like protein 22 isoform X1 n=1 Tax=Ananas comosus TaxID=4615 RepID=A0A6P5GNN8_ANACO|nr:methyltransferase-like protein 22 isoform X1 [Ananas comosus]